MAAPGPDIRVLTSYRGRNGRALYDAITSACEVAGFAPRIAQDAPQLTSVVNLVATGIAIAIVPASMGRLATGDVRYLPIAGRPPQAPMALARAKTPATPLATIFTDLAVAQIRSAGSCVAGLGGLLRS